MLQNNIKADKFIFSSLIKKCDTFNEAWEFFQDMQTQNIKPDKYIYVQLVNKAITTEDTDKIINYIQENSIFLPIRDCTILFKKQRDFVKAWGIYQYMLNAHFLPSHNELNFLALLSTTDSEAWLIFEQIKNFQVWIQKDSFNHLIEKMNNFSKAWKIYQCMKSLKTTPNQKTFTLLTKLASTSDEYWEVKQEKDKKFKPKNRQAT